MALTNADEYAPLASLVQFVFHIASPYIPDNMLAPQTANRAAAVRAKMIFITLFVTVIQFTFVTLRRKGTKKNVKTKAILEDLRSSFCKSACQSPFIRYSLKSNYTLSRHTLILKHIRPSFVTFFALMARNSQTFCNFAAELR
jgi:hypothetical protein